MLFTAFTAKWKNYNGACDCASIFLERTCNSVIKFVCIDIIYPFIFFWKQLKTLFNHYLKYQYFPYLPRNSNLNCYSFPLYPVFTVCWVKMLLFSKCLLLNTSYLICPDPVLIITAYRCLILGCIEWIFPFVPCNWECFSFHTLVRAYGFAPEPVKIQTLCWVNSFQSCNQVNQTEAWWQRFPATSFTSGMVYSFWCSLSWVLMILELVAKILVGTFLKLSAIVCYFKASFKVTF